MLVDEDIALEKYCPKQFVTNGNLNDCKCFGSDCMAWQWEDPCDETTNGRCVLIDGKNNITNFE